MKERKGAIIMMVIAVVLFFTSCGEQLKKEKIVGQWKYERMTTGPMHTSADTLTHVLSEQVYVGSVLQFFKNDSFEMINKDTASSFQGKGLYQLDAKAKTLTMERGVKNGVSDKMTVQVMELTEDSLKLGNKDEMLVYSRIKE